MDNLPSEVDPIQLKYLSEPCIEVDEFDNPKGLSYFICYLNDEPNEIQVQSQSWIVTESVSITCC
jgi:hypothetical protein